MRSVAKEARMRDEIPGTRSAESETESLRRERGAAGGAADPRERMADVPLAPHSAGVLGTGIVDEGSDVEASPTADADRDADERRHSR